MTRVRAKDAVGEVLHTTSQCISAVGETISVIPAAAKIMVRNYERNSNLEYLIDLQDAELDEQKLEKNLTILGKFSN